MSNRTPLPAHADAAATIAPNLETFTFAEKSLGLDLASFEGGTARQQSDAQNIKRARSSAASSESARFQAIAAALPGGGELLANVALAWVRQQPAVSCTLMGARDVGQLQRNLRSLELELSPATLGQLNEAGDELKKLLVDFSMNTTYLRWPDQSFSVQKGLVQPWHQLQLAQSNMSEFFPDGSASQAFDLAPKMAEALQTFEQVWRDEVAKYARMWNMAQYGDAEGNPSRGLMRLSILVHGIKTANGGELGALAAVRRRIRRC